MTRAALTRRTDVHQKTVAWFEDFILTHADMQPNSMEAHLELSTKKEIWEIYKREMRCLYGENEVVLNYDTWVQIWNVCFPYLKIREYKAVSGKCWTCHYISELRQKTSNRDVLLACKMLHQLHRGGLYSIERAR